MPIRLLVAIVVGAAALSLLLPLPEDVAAADDEEVTVRPSPAQLQPGANVTLAVLTEDGDPVKDTTVVVRGRSLAVKNGPLRLETGPDSHTVSFRVGLDRSGGLVPGFRPTQNRGTLTVEVLAPGEGYVDERPNPQITVVARRD